MSKVQRSLWNLANDDGTNDTYKGRCRNVPNIQCSSSWTCILSYGADRPSSRHPSLTMEPNTRPRVVVGETRDWRGRGAPILPIRHSLSRSFIFDLTGKYP